MRVVGESDFKSPESRPSECVLFIAMSLFERTESSRVVLDFLCLHEAALAKTHFGSTIKFWRENSVTSSYVEPSWHKGIWKRIHNAMIV